MMKLCFRSRLLLLVLTVLVDFSTAWAADVCRAYSFEGMHANKMRAEKFVGDTTTVEKNIKLYIEFTSDGKLYYHSNYITPEYENPTKIAGKPSENQAFADVQKMFLNIMYSEPPSVTDTYNAEELLRNNVDVFIDESIFDSNGVPRIDLSEIKNIHIVNGNKGVELASGGEVLTTLKPPPSLIAKIKGCCFFARPPHRANEFSELLQKREFRASEVRIASLFIDTGTDNAFKQSKSLKSARLNGDGKSIKSLNDLEKLFISSKGKTLILLGHVEGSDFVIRNAKNKEQFRTTIESVRNLAKRESVSLIDIGCETTKAILTQTLGFGVATKYNSVEAVKSISYAMETSNNYAEFMTNISSEGLKLVVDESFVINHVQTVQTSIYSRLKVSAKEVWIKVARVTISQMLK